MIKIGRRGVVILTFKGLIVLVIVYWLFIGLWEKTPMQNPIKTKGSWEHYLGDTTIRMNLKGNFRFSYIMYVPNQKTSFYEGYFDDGWKINGPNSSDQSDTLILITDQTDTVLNDLILLVNKKNLQLKNLNSGKITHWKKIE